MNGEAFDLEPALANQLVEAEAVNSEKFPRDLLLELTNRGYLEFPED